MKRIGFFLAISAVFAFLFSSQVFAKEPENKQFLRVIFEFSINNGAAEDIRLFAVVDPYTLYTLGSFDKGRRTIVCGRKKVDSHSYLARVWPDSSVGDTFAFMAGQFGDRGFTAVLSGSTEFRTGSYGVSSFVYTPEPVEFRITIYSNKAMVDFTERLIKEDQERGKNIQQFECKAVSEK